MWPNDMRCNMIRLVSVLSMIEGIQVSRCGTASENGQAAEKVQPQPGNIEGGAPEAAGIGGRLAHSLAFLSCLNARTVSMLT